MPLYEVKGRDEIDSPPHPDVTDLTVTGILSTHVIVKNLYGLGRVLWATGIAPPPPWVFTAKWKAIEKGKTVTIFLGPVPGVPPFSHTLYFRKLKYLRTPETDDVTATISVEEKNIT